MSWTPIESNKRSIVNEQLANYRQPFNWRGMLILIFMALVVVGFAVMLITLFPIMIHVPDVSTPVAVWTEIP